MEVRDAVTNPLGIDLGTTNAVAGVVTDAGVEIIPVGAGERALPSVVAAPSPSETTSVLVGAAAANRAPRNPEGTVTSIKRHMGESTPVTLHGEPFQPEAAAALVLKKVVADAEAYLHRPVEEAVVTVPSSFTERQRAATVEAAELAGISVCQLLDEPTAGCLAHGYDRHVDDERVLVYDLGGGTFDVSLIDVGAGVYEPIATACDTRLGGDDWDERVASWIVDRVDEERGNESITEQATAMGRIREQATEVTHTLSARPEARISLPSLTAEYDFEARLSRETFEALTADLLDRTLDTVTELLEPSEPDAIDTLLLIGGATRMPQIERGLGRRVSAPISREVRPAEAVANGAARRAAHHGEGTGVVRLADRREESLDRDRDDLPTIR